MTVSIPEERRVKIESQLDIVSARQAVRELAARVGFQTSEITIIAMGPLTTMASSSSYVAAPTPAGGGRVADSLRDSDDATRR